MKYADTFSAALTALAMLLAMPLSAQTPENMLVFGPDGYIESHDVSSISHLSVSENTVLTAIDSDNNPTFGYDDLSKITRLVFDYNPDQIRCLDISTWPVDDGTGLSTSLATVSLQAGEVVKFVGYTGENPLPNPDFFILLENGNYYFVGNSAEDYRLAYNASNGATYIDRPTAEEPEALWIVGTKFGHPSVVGASSPDWNQDSPAGRMMAKKVKDGIFELSLYLDNDFELVVFPRYGWDNAYTPQMLTSISAVLDKQYFIHENGGGHLTNSFIPGPKFIPGVYTVRINLNTGVCAVKKYYDNTEIFYAINDTKLTPKEDLDGYLSCQLSLKQGQPIVFTGFKSSLLKYKLQPQFFRETANGYEFAAPDGVYEINFYQKRGLIYVERVDNPVKPGCLWITGNYIGHPATDGLMPEEIGTWGFDNPKDYICLTPTSEDVYEGDIFLKASYGGDTNKCEFRIYSGKGMWNNGNITPQNSTLVSFDCGIAAEGLNFVPGENFAEGRYHVVVNLFDNTVSFSRVHKLYDGGYLFAHMTDDSYGSIFYSLSRDGYNWETINGANPILPDYIGHPDICKGRDEVYYMISVEKNTGNLWLWNSTDLVKWNHQVMSKTMFNKISDLYGYKNEETYYGAPKMYYDEPSDQYIITWHAGTTGNDGKAEEWASKRTFYILTSDFMTFTEPKFLFEFTGTDANMPTIDVIIRKEGDFYYAVMKDERTQEAAPTTGKTIRIAKSKNLTGPYENPGQPITPLNPWHEAHTIVPAVNGEGYLMYTENYMNHQYDLFVGSTLDGFWTQREIPTLEVRHGCVIRIDETEYQTIENAFKRSVANPFENKTKLEFFMPDNTTYALDGTAQIEVRLSDGQTAPEDIPIRLVTTEDPENRILIYNNTHGSQFALMPEKAFNGNVAGVIRQGSTSTTINVEVDLEYLSECFSDKPFLLPITLESDDKHYCRHAGYIASPIIREIDGVVNIYTYGTTPTAQVYNTEKINGKAVIAFPGGGYGNLATNEMAHFKDIFQDKDVAIAVVSYRMPNGNHTIPSTDAYNVLQLMINNRNQWGGYSKIGVMGCSAGAHVATTLSSYVPEKIDFQILLYPLITMNPEHTHKGSHDALFMVPSKSLEDAFSGELQVSASTPPAYIGYSLDDNIVDPIWNGMAYAKVLVDNGVNILEKPHDNGGHWIGEWNDYPESLFGWLDTIR